jgi:hypothetical protein
MVDAGGSPVLYKCWRTGRIGQPQHPVKRDTPKPPTAAVVKPIAPPPLQLDRHEIEWG